VGHLVFAAGADGGKPKLLMLGRLLSGISYEVIDIMTIPLTSPFFQVYYRNILLPTSGDTAYVRHRQPPSHSTPLCCVATSAAPD
jgi:hypothetical protein